MHAQKFRRHHGAVFLGVVDHDRGDEGHAFGEQVRLLDGEFPLEAEVAFGAGFGVLRDDGDEQRTGVDLLANFRVPRVAAAELVFVEPHVEAGAAQRLGDAARRSRVVASVAEEDRLGR